VTGPTANEDLAQALVALARDTRLATVQKAFTWLNVFLAGGPRWKETDHSATLAFLLNPTQMHGLGDSVLRALLAATKEANPGQVGLIPDNMSSATVRTEVHHIYADDEQARAGSEEVGTLPVVAASDDQSSQSTVLGGTRGRIDILVQDEANKLAIILENKTRSNEHDNQLTRYYNTVHYWRPDWDIVAVFLSPSAEEPTDKRWARLGYRRISTLLEGLARTSEPAPDPNVQVLLIHYADLIRRNLVGDNDIDALYRSLYREHGDAIERIKDYVDARRRRVVKRLGALAGETQDVVIDGSWNGQGPLSPYPGWYVRIAYTPWDDIIPPNKKVTFWTDTGRIMLFTVEIRADHLGVDLTVGPGNIADRARFLRIAGHAPLQEAAGADNGLKTWTTIYRAPLLGVDQWAALGDAELEDVLDAWWKTFTTTLIPAVHAQVLLYVEQRL